MLPTDSGYIQPMFGGIGATLSQDEAEIELLISRGYTRIQAVQIYEQKKRRDYEVISC